MPPTPVDTYEVLLPFKRTDDVIFPTTLPHSRPSSSKQRIINSKPYAKGRYIKSKLTKSDDAASCKGLGHRGSPSPSPSPSDSNPSNTNVLLSLQLPFPKQESPRRLLKWVIDQSNQTYPDSGEGTPPLPAITQRSRRTRDCALKYQSRKEQENTPSISSELDKEAESTSILFHRIPNSQTDVCAGKARAISPVSHFPHIARPLRLEERVHLDNRHRRPSLPSCFDAVGRFHFDSRTSAPKARWDSDGDRRPPSPDVDVQSDLFDPPGLYPSQNLLERPVSAPPEFSLERFPVYSYSSDEDCEEQINRLFEQYQRSFRSPSRSRSPR